MMKRLYLAPAHDYPGIIRNRAITDRATASEHHERARSQANDRKMSHRHTATRRRCPAGHKQTSHLRPANKIALRLFEIAGLLVRLDHVASIIVNAEF
jgi:hypothetical protein